MDEPGIPDRVSANIELKLADRTIALEVQVPTAPVPPRRLLPLAQRLADAVIEASVEADAQPVRCAKGCGACCRQLVPISPVEARAIHALVEALEEPRRSQIVGRFAAAVRRVREAGLADRLRDFSLVGDAGAMSQFGIDYLRLGMPCPFLEDEACSIHPERPLTCREYLVTSDPRHCADPRPEVVRRVPLEARVSRALPALEKRTDTAGTRWLALILALEWVQENPTQIEVTGPQLLQSLFGALSRKDLPMPPGLGGDDK